MCVCLHWWNRIRYRHYLLFACGTVAANKQKNQDGNHSFCKAIDWRRWSGFLIYIFQHVLTLHFVVSIACFFLSLFSLQQFCIKYETYCFLMVYGREGGVWMLMVASPQSQFYSFAVYHRCHTVIVAAAFIACLCFFVSRSQPKGLI